MSQQLQQLCAESKKMDAQIEAKSDDARCYMIYYMVYIEHSQQRSTICQHTIVYYVYHIVHDIVYCCYLLLLASQLCRALSWHGFAQGQLQTAAQQALSDSLWLICCFSDANGSWWQRERQCHCKMWIDQIFSRGRRWRCRSARLQRWAGPPKRLESCRRGADTSHMLGNGRSFRSQDQVTSRVFWARCAAKLRL